MWRIGPETYYGRLLFCCHIDCLTCSSVNVCLGYLSKCVSLDARLGYGFETHAGDSSLEH